MRKYSEFFPGSGEFVTRISTAAERARLERPFTDTIARHMLESIAKRFGLVRLVFIERTKWNADRPMVPATPDEIRSAYTDETMVNTLLDLCNYSTNELLGESDVSPIASETYLNHSGGGVQFDLLILPIDVTIPEVGNVLQKLFSQGQRKDAQEGQQTERRINDVYTLLADGAHYLEAALSSIEKSLQDEQHITQSTTEGAKAMSQLKKMRWEKGIEATKEFIAQMRKTAAQYISIEQDEQNFSNERLEEIENFLLGAENAQKRRERAMALTNAVVEGKEGPQTVTPDQRQRLGERFVLRGEEAFRASQLEADESILEQLRRKSIEAFVYAMGVDRVHRVLDQGKSSVQRSSIANIERAAHQPLYELLAGLWHMGRNQLIELMSVTSIAHKIQPFAEQMITQRERLLDVIPLDDMKRQLQEARENAERLGNLRILGDAEIAAMVEIRKFLSKFDYKSGKGGEASLAETPIDNTLNCVEYSTIGLEIAEILGLNMRAISVPGHSTLMLCTADGRLQWQEMQFLRDQPEVVAQDLYGGDKAFQLLKNVFMHPEKYPNGAVIHYTNIDIFKEVYRGATEHNDTSFNVLPKNLGTLSQLMGWVLEEDLGGGSQSDVAEDVDQNRCEGVQWVLDAISELGGENNLLFYYCAIAEKREDYDGLYMYAKKGIQIFPLNMHFYAFLRTASEKLAIQGKEEYDIIQKSLQRFPLNAKLHGLAMSYWYRTEGNEKAKNYIERIIEQNNGTAWAHRLNADLIQEESGEYPANFRQTQQYLWDVYEKNQTEAHLFEWKNYCLFWINSFRSQNNFNEMIVIATTCLSKKSDPDFHVAKFDAFIGLQQNDQALECIDQALLEFRDSAELVVKKANHLYDHTRPDAAYEFWQQYMSGEPTYDLVAKYVKFLNDRKDYERLESYCQEFLENIQNNKYKQYWNVSYFESWQLRARRNMDVT